MPQRESLDVDVLIVGAGPAGLATALHLTRLYEQCNKEIESGTREGPKLSTENICVLEKGRDVGGHLLSGAVIDPRALQELLPDFRSESSEFHDWSVKVRDDSVYFLLEKSQWKLPILPPFLKNAGNFVTSLNRLGRWLGEKVEAGGASSFAGFAGRELLFENGSVVGVRTDDKGRDRRGQEKSNFQLGYDIHARLTILCEGSHGSLTKQLIAAKALNQDRNPQVYAVGIKELWEIPPGQSEPGSIIHTAGWPLSSKEYGGGWIYGLPDGKVSLGLVCGLDYSNPRFDPHQAFQQFKTHPLLQKVLAGGKLLKYGAKTIPEGGWFAIPKLYVDGAIIAGDSGGLLNAQRLKGVHLAIKSGMLAAETAMDALLNSDFSESQLGNYERRIRESWIRDELWLSRNFRQAFEGSMVKGIFHVGLQMLTGGRGLHARYTNKPGHTQLHMLDRENSLNRQKPPSADGKLTFNKLTDVFHSGTKHIEDQPCHLLIDSTDICNTRCTVEYGNPCQHFCPAAVYEMIESRGKQVLNLNPSNCVHCKTCDIMDPYQIITWVPPEGGGGPNYENL